MSPALHIAAKDLRALQIPALIVAALQLGYAALHAEPQQPGDFLRRTGSLDSLLLLLAHAWFVSRAVHAEAIAGNRQYWLTRPIAGRHLLLAKLLATLTVIHIPLLFSDSIILLGHGFSPIPYLPGLLWRQLLYFLIATLPMLAVAAATANLLQFSGAAFLSVLTVLILPATIANNLDEPTWSGLHWIRLQTTHILLAAGGITALALLYANRRVIASRITLAAAAALIPGAFAFTPFPAMFHLQRSLGASQAVARTVVFDTDAQQARQNMRSPRNAFIRGIAIPFRFEPRLTAQDIYLDQVLGVIRAAGGATANVRVLTASPLDSTSPGHHIFLNLDRDFISRHREESVTIQLTFYLTAFCPSRQYTMPVIRERSAIPEIGRCAATPEAGMVNLTCYSPVRSGTRVTVQLVHPSTGVRTQRELRLNEDVNYTPLPSDRFRYNPMNYAFTYFSVMALPGEDLMKKSFHHLLESNAVFSVRDPQSHFTTELSIPPTPLKEFMP